MDLRTSSLPSDVLVQFYTAVRITVAVVFFTITRKPPSFLVQAGPPLAALTTAFSPCFIVLLVPYYLRLATRRTLCDAPRYVDESVCTDVEEEDERTAVELSDVDISSDDTVIHDINWGEDDSNVKKCESRDVVFLNEIPGEAGRDGEDVVKEGPSEGNEEALLDRRDMMPSDEIIHDISPDEEDAGNSERLEEADIEFSDEITRAIDLDEMVVGGDAKLEENDMVSCGQAPDITDQSTEEDIVRELPPPKVNTHQPSPTPDFPPSSTLSGKRLRAYWDPAPGNELYISRQTRTFESFHAALESRTRPPWSFR